MTLQGTTAAVFRLFRGGGVVTKVVSVALVPMVTGGALLRKKMWCYPDGTDGTINSPLTATDLIMKAVPTVT